VSSAPHSRLRIAIQKSGRLADNSRDLLVRCGLRISPNREGLVWSGENLPIDLMLVRDDDIPTLVADGHCDLGIVGMNIAREVELDRIAEGLSPGYEEILPLDFGYCRLAIAQPVRNGLTGAESLNGKRIATSYPASLRAFLAEKRIEAEVVLLSGSVELAPRLGKADVVCDLVSTGATLAANDLEEMLTILESKATLIRATAPLPEDSEALLARLMKRMQGVLRGRESKYIMLHAPREHLAEITSLLPGCEAPTVLQLEGRSDRVAVHAVCNEYVFWDTLEALKGAGASAILVLPVEKMLS
jgi:ATP phosphoribosyltransferase